MAIEQLSKTGEFFSVSLQALDQIAAQEGLAEEVLGYLVLARHATGKGLDWGRLTSAGASAVQKKVGLSWRSAVAALEWLRDNTATLADGKTARFIEKAEDAREQFGTEQVPEHFGYGKSSGRNTKVRWCLPQFDNPIYLPNALIDGIGKGKENPPLTRIYNDVEPEFDEDITMPLARLDAAMLLVHLYRHHDLEECGGVDPRSGVYREWTVAEADQSESWLDRDPVMAVEGTNAAVYEIEGNCTTMWLAFAKEALFYVQGDEERNRRFWCAFNNLDNLGFFYEVITVWSSDPLARDRKKGKQAELLYTLYICDRYARTNEPYLQREIHSTLLRRGELDPSELGFNGTYTDDDGLINSGRFRFIANRKTGAYPLGVFRLRYRPKDRDTGRGMAAEQKRCLHWENVLRKLSGSPQITEGGQSLRTVV